MKKHPNLIRFDSNNSECDGHLIIFKRPGSEPPLPEGYVHDYVLIMNAGFDNEDLANYAKEEDDIIKREEKNDRSGGANGRMLVSDPTSKYSNATVSDATLYYTSEGSAALQIHYETKSHKITTVARGCKKTHSRKVPSTKKKATAQRSNAMRGILADTGICCLITLASLEKVDINPPTVGNITFLSKLGNIIEQHQQDGCSNPRDVIADYMCMFETTHNYSTNAAHYDAHGPEVLNVFSRHNTTMSSKEAYLYFPLYNIVLVFQVNSTTSVGNLTKTIHMADRSRDNVTFSISQWVAEC